MPDTNRSVFRIGLIQISCGPEPEENLAKAERFIRKAAAEGAQIICLPELFRTQYFCREMDHRHLALAEPIPGPTTESLSELAAELRVVVIAGLFERRGPGIYHNSTAILGPAGDLLGVYRKMHIPEERLYHEKFYFTPGDGGFPVFATSYGRFGVQICWDQWFPEAARASSLGGAAVLFYPSAIGWNPEDDHDLQRTERDAWLTIQRGHAIANGIYVAALNRVGVEGPPGAALKFWGSSFIVDPHGKVIADASETGEQVLLADINPQECENTRQLWPFFRDRRVDTYGPLLKLWRNDT